MRWIADCLYADETCKSDADCCDSLDCQDSKCTIRAFPNFDSLPDEGTPRSILWQQSLALSTNCAFAINIWHQNGQPRSCDSRGVYDTFRRCAECAGFQETCRVDADCCDGLDCGVSGKCEFRAHPSLLHASVPALASR